ncbi:hypothetical protein WAI453_005958 [Rhynchosporium graminicola]
MLFPHGIVASEEKYQLSPNRCLHSAHAVQISEANAHLAYQTKLYLIPLDECSQPQHLTPMHFRMSSSTNQSHATGGSVVPNKAQEKLPKGVEESVPNSVHDTGSQGRQSHATGDSVVPEKLQEILPESVERAVPNAIHDTSKLPPKNN